MSDVINSDILFIHFWLTKLSRWIRHKGNFRAYRRHGSEQKQNIIFCFTLGWFLWRVLQRFILLPYPLYRVFHISENQTMKCYNQNTENFPIDRYFPTPNPFHILTWKVVQLYSFCCTLKWNRTNSIPTNLYRNHLSVNSGCCGFYTVIKNIPFTSLTALGVSFLKIL